MLNSITKILNIQDDNINVKTKQIVNNTKIIEISRNPSPKFCPVCGFRMHSKGVRIRNVNHPILQDGYRLILEVHQRRFMCTNPDCKELVNDEFTFLSPRKRNTNQTELMVVDAFRNHSSSAREIAKRFNISDTLALQIFDKYVDMKRLPLSEVISIDEVYLDMPGCKYALVIFDFISGEPIDILPNRYDKTTEEYFSKIPIKERARVKYLISDMYAPYLNYVGKYFPNAIPAVDSFHVIKELNSSLDNYRKKLLKKFQDRDEALRTLQGTTPGRRYRQSDEVYLLKNHKWLLLGNPLNTRDKNKPRWDKHFHGHLDTYQYENLFFKIDPNLSELRRLKEKYHEFNAFCIGNPERAAKELDDLIYTYAHSNQPIFINFARLLRKRRTEIISSFSTVLCNGIERRLSNSAIESMNRVPKDMKRLARGYRNFNHIRNRILFALRDDAPILGLPKSSDEIKNSTGRTRGSYRKSAIESK